MNLEDWTLNSDDRSIEGRGESRGGRLMTETEDFFVSSEARGCF